MERTDGLKRLLLAFLIIFATWALLSTQFHLGIWISRDDGKEDVISADADNIEVGTHYALDQDDVKTDEKTGITYVDNIIIVFFY